MFGLIIKAALVSIMWFGAGFAACAAVSCRLDEDEDDYHFYEFLFHSLWFGALALIDTALFVWSVYPG